MPKRMCRDDRIALDALDKATVNPKHIHLAEPIDVDNVHINSHDVGR